MSLSNLTPNLTAAIIITLIAAAVVLEVNDSENSLLLITMLVGVLGLQQSRTSQATNRIEQQTNGIMEQRHAEIQAQIAQIAETQRMHGEKLSLMTTRLADGDLTFEVMRAANAGASKAIAEIKTRLDDLTSCEPKGND